MLVPSARLSRCKHDDATGEWQGDQLSGKLGDVREFDSCQENVRDFTEDQGIVREKSCQGKVA